MKFSFSADQLLFRDSLREFLDKECPPELLCSLAQSESGRSPELWQKLAELGVVGGLVPERFGGTGLSEHDTVLLQEEPGRSGLAEPLIESAAVAVPLLRDLGGEPAEKWLQRVAAGEARLAVGHPVNPFVADAHHADLLLLPHDGELFAVPGERVSLTRQPSSDDAARLYRVDFTPSPELRVAHGARADALLADLLDRGALACAAQLVGAGRRLVELAVAYAAQREQFGVPIGSFQAVKHMLASVQVELEFARPALYRAAWAVAHGTAQRSVDVSQAKFAAGEAALRAARTSLQVHGAIGYTYEQNVHVWMKRAWHLDTQFGTRAYHRARVAAAVIDGDHPIGPRGP